MAVVIEPVGGLGNQLFIYATGRALSVRTGLPLVADTFSYRTYTNHDYELDSFRNHISQSVCKRMVSKPLIQRSMRNAEAILPGFMTESPTLLVNEKIKHWNGRRVRIRGYFQSEQYFVDSRMDLKSELEALRSPSTWFLEQKQALQEIGTWIGVQVRSGPTGRPPSMGLLGRDYYQRALSLLRTEVTEAPTVIFTDNLHLLPDRLPRNIWHGAIILDPPPESRPLESLLLMSSASHLVIANSTFGWWAGWINEHERRTVIAPRPWIDDRIHNDKDLIPDSWISLGRASDR